MLKIAILSRTLDAYSTRRLKEAAAARGHKSRVLNTLRFSMLVERGRPRLFYNDRPISRYDAVIPRIGASITMFGTAVVRQFEQLGVFTLNSAQAISAARDKLRCSQMLSRRGLPIPATAFVRERPAVLSAIERVGGAPVVVKLLEGAQGVGVILADTPRVAEAIVQTLQSARQNVLIQKFVKESHGRDIRAFVVGDRVVAAMRRIALDGEFRSNVHRGARAEPVEVDPESARMAVRAAQIMGLQVAGVDMVESDSGPQIIEVNSSPGLEGIETATGVDIAGAMVVHLEQQVQFPEVDIRERLTLKSGYGVAEFVVLPESELAEKTLAEAALREREVQVLSISRGALTIPNPRGDCRILPGDELLCFGNRLSLRGLIPPTGRRRRASGMPPPGPSEPP